jgi:hypothetical protein
VYVAEDSYSVQVAKSTDTDGTDLWPMDGRKEIGIGKEQADRSVSGRRF